MLKDIEKTCLGHSIFAVEWSTAVTSKVSGMEDLIIEPSVQILVTCTVVRKGWLEFRRNAAQQ